MPARRESRYSCTSTTLLLQGTSHATCINRHVEAAGCLQAAYFSSHPLGVPQPFTRERKKNPRPPGRDNCPAHLDVATGTIFPARANSPRTPRDRRNESKQAKTFIPERGRAPRLPTGAVVLDAWGLGLSPAASQCGRTGEPRGRGGKRDIMGLSPIWPNGLLLMPAGLGGSTFSVLKWNGAVAQGWGPEGGLTQHSLPVSPERGTRSQSLSSRQMRKSTRHGTSGDGKMNRILSRVGLCDRASADEVGGALIDTARGGKEADLPAQYEQYGTVCGRGFPGA